MESPNIFSFNKSFNSDINESVKSDINESVKSDINIYG